MIKINVSQTHFSKVFLVIFVIFFVNNFCLAQNEADLEIKVQPASETIRGGETFSYTITVSNIGSAKAKEVNIVNELSNMAEFVSNSSSKGTCRLYKPQHKTNLYCSLDEIDVGEIVTVLVEVKIEDFGGEYESPQMEESRKSMMKVLESLTGKNEGDSKGSLIGDIEVFLKESDKNKENNNVSLYVKNLLPSKNLPPRVQIISPKEEEVFTRSSKKLSKIVFTIKAFDPDGTIEKVEVNTQQFSISIEYPENKFIIDGKTYSIKEVEENKKAFQKYFGGEAVKIDKDTYTFTLENPKYGLNLIFVKAIDNGKRVGSAAVRLTVKGDNTIEFTKPFSNSIIKPNTDLIIETSSKLNDGEPAAFRLIGPALCCEDHFMKEISKNGNFYSHRYVWKNIPKGSYYVQILLIEPSGAFTYSEPLKFTVTEKPTIKITSIKNGQTFNQGEDIPIEIEATDFDGTIEDVSVSVDDKYERDFSWRQGSYKKSGDISSLRKGIYKIKATATDDLKVKVESEAVTIIIK